MYSYGSAIWVSVILWFIKWFKCDNKGAEGGNIIQTNLSIDLLPDA